MAKKEKVQLTPEEIIQKKIRRSDRWTRFWAVVVALALTAGVFAFARSQGIKASEATEVETSENAENNSNSNNNSSNTNSNTPSNSSSTDNSSSSNSSSSSSTDNNSAAPADNSGNGGGDAAAANDPASVAALINKVTGEAVAAKAGYNWARDCTVANIDVGGSFATNAINSLIGTISKGDDLNSVVGGFLGNGSKSETVPKGMTLDTIDVQKDDGGTEKLYHGSSYTLKAANIQAGDIQNLAVSGDTYEFDLVDSPNPDRSGNTAFSRFCNDIVVREEVESELKGYTDKVTVDSLDAQYHNIHVKAVITDGKLKELTYSMKADATLKIKLGFAITGTGNLDATAKYMNIDY
ncbi:MAG: hypothetical protein Q3968_03395 [Clostridiaceae bacterium]|nr:hypothetical protein [Clostridiaceae bacterium]